MSEAREESTELKAGHAPAKKVAGVRIAQSAHDARIRTTSEEKAAIKEAKEDEKAEEKKKPGSKDHRMTKIDGVLVTDTDVYTPESVKSIHERKPEPTHDFHVCSGGSGAKPRIQIQQPQGSRH